MWTILLCYHRDADQLQKPSPKCLVTAFHSKNIAREAAVRTRIWTCSPLIPSPVCEPLSHSTSYVEKNKEGGGEETKKAQKADVC